MSPTNPAATHVTYLFIVGVLASSTLISVGVGAGVYHRAQVRAADASAAAKMAMRATVADHASPSRQMNAVEAQVLTALPEVTVATVTVSSKSVARVQDPPKKARRRASVWSSIKGLFSKHA